MPEGKTSGTPLIEWVRADLAGVYQLVIDANLGGLFFELKNALCGSAVAFHPNRGFFGLDLFRFEPAALEDGPQAVVRSWRCSSLSLLREISITKCSAKRRTEKNTSPDRLVC